MELERRYLLSPFQVKEIFSLLEGHVTPQIHDPLRPRAYTRTTYLDTWDFEYLRSYEQRVARRLRIRQYASAALGDDAPRFSSPCFLELKESFGVTRGKQRFSVTPSRLPGLLCGREPLSALAPFACLDNPHLARVGSQLARGQLRPILTTWYRRRSYLGEGGRARLTLDEHTQFVGGKAFGFVGQKAAPTHILGAGPAWILEVKCLGAVPGWLLDAVAGCEASSFSKYRWGVQALQQTRRAA